MSRCPALILSVLLSLFPVLAMAGGWALGGMDAVAYQADGDAVAGQAGISTRWAGQEWHFATEENRAIFEANPRSFAPGLGGNCPIALAKGRLIQGNPRYFAVVGQRLYLLQSAEARQVFLDDPRQWLMAAKAAFVKIAR